MIPGQLDYVRPGSLDEALRILRDREGEAKILSGGYSLIPLLKLRLAQPGLLVDIGAVDGLDSVVETDDHLVMGARATHRRINEDPVVRDRYPGIVDLTGHIGDPQVRNWGTIGGSVAHADPASDWPALLLAVNATLVCRSAARLPQVMVRTASRPSIAGHGRSPTACASSPPPLSDSAPWKIRTASPNPAALGPTERNAVKAVGAPWYTSGLHMWKGAMAILKPTPASTSASAKRRSPHVPFPPPASRLRTASPSPSRLEVPSRP